MRRFHFSERPDSFEIDPQHQLAQQLVFAGLGRYNGGLYFHDSSLYGNHGTLKNMAPSEDWARALGRWALDFDGSNDYGTAPIPLANRAFAISAFLNTTTFGNRTFIGCGTRGTRVGLHCRASNSSSMLFGLYGDDLAFAVTSYNWGHVVCQIAYPSNYMSGFSNGSLKNSKTAGGPFVGVGDVAVGRATWGEYWLGGIADLCIWYRTLSPSEISALADPGNVMLSLGGSDPGLLRYRRKWWPVVSGAAPATKYWLWARQRRSQIIGGGVT